MLMHGQTAPKADARQTPPWWAAAPLADAAAHPEVGLNPAELARAGGYVAGRPRNDFVAGRVLVRVLAADVLNRAMPQGLEMPPVLPGELELTQHCPQCASTSHGNPRLQLPGRGQGFSLSYARTAGWVLLALAPGNDLLGVDMADSSDPAFASGDGELLEDYAFAPAERRHLESLAAPERRNLRARWWALKEAVAKASGDGLAGEDGIPVVAGDRRHRLLGDQGTQTIELDSGTPDTRGNLLPSSLLGSIVWAPGATA
ncbi:4'-phosphopantetheinyl transferase family protein [Paeniglutamicibacter sp.]|uniref:4'-phosphopantetheinyl transferase family protein n=1 Tax=Paeniglutamicibacter sp. TaxID=1934391 RepID=UPI003988C84D